MEVYELVLSGNAHRLIIALAKYLNTLTVVSEERWASTRNSLKQKLSIAVLTHALEDHEFFSVSNYLYNLRFL